MKLIFASLLLVLLLTLSGLAVAGATSHSADILAWASRFAVAGTAAPRENAGVSLASTSMVGTGAALQQGGVIDARAVVRRTGPAVVTVINHLDLQTGTRPSTGIAPESSGSGVIVSTQGYIVTNNHVVENAKSLEVIFSAGKKATAKLIGTDSFSDLAVIKVDVPVPAVAEFGDSDKLEAGQPVVAIGSALGKFQNTVTAGVVSGVHRDLGQGGAPELRNLIQTDAAINHGNSGGPLLDLDGKIVGISVAVLRSAGSTADVAEGLGFAIPSNTARVISEQLTKTGSVVRPYLGITYQEIDAQVASYYNLSRQQGVYVSEVVSGSPAGKAGVEADSIITRFDGIELKPETPLLELLMKHKAGDTVTMSVLPKGASTEKTVTVTLGTRPSAP